MHQSMQAMEWQFMNLDDIKQIRDPITVFLRNPKQRFFSGVNTYLQHLTAQGLNLNLETVLYYINQHLFLNRHYAPQFFWLLNLARFVGSDARVSLCSVEQISQLTTRHSRAEVEPLTPQLQQQIEKFDWSKLELYFYLDQILVDQIGQTVKISDLIRNVRNNHKELYELVFQKTLDISNVLSTS